MMVRRGFLGLLLSSPLAAGHAVNAAATGVAAGVPVGVSNPSPSENPIDRAFSRARRRHEIKMSAHDARPEHMPPSIDGKKSWSSAFKQHVFAKERMARVDPWSLETDAARKAFIKYMGLEI